MRVSQPRPGEPIKVVTSESGAVRYRVRLDTGVTASGKRRQSIKTFETLTDARKYIAAHRTDRERGVLLSPDRQTFADYSAKWLAQRSREVRTITAMSYRSAIKHAVAGFGRKRLSQIERADVEAVVHALADKGRSKRTAAMTLFVLRSIFEAAIDDKLMAFNPALRVKPIGKEAKERASLDSADIGKLRRHLASDRLYGVWLLTLLGLRRSEVLGLTWNDLDLTSGELTIERGRVSLGTLTTTTPPKTRRGARVITLPNDVIAALRQLRKAQLGQFGATQARSGYLAIDESGQPIHPADYSALWRNHCEAAGVPIVTLHAARHSAVTTLREAGVSDHVVAALAGHDEVVMRRTYSHARAAGIAQAAEVLSAAYGAEQD